VDRVPIIRIETGDYIRVEDERVAVWKA
jgi:hypothetical protein